MNIITQSLKKTDLTWVSWTSKQIEKKKDQIIAEMKKNIERIIALPDGERTFENTLWNLHHNEILAEGPYINFLVEVSTKKTVRDSAHASSIAIAEADVELYGNPDLYQAIKGFAKTKSAKALKGPEKKLLEDTLQYFRRTGLELTPAKQKEYQKIEKKLIALSTTYQRNLNDYEGSILVTKDQLQGLSDDYIARLAKKGKLYKVTVSRADYVTFMAYAESEPQRKKLAQVYAKKGGKKNMQILEKMVILRHKKAVLLGYKSFSDFINEPKMAKSQKQVMEFLRDTHGKVVGVADEYIQEMTAFAETESNGNVSELTYSNKSYWARKYKAAQLDLDEQVMKEYLTLENVRTTLFKVAKDVFGVTLKKVNLPTWHKDVQIYSVSVGAQLRGYIGMDLYPRTGKYGHAALFDIKKARQVTCGSSKAKAPLGVIVMNLPSPSKSHPSLLSFYEVTVLFHEFGHALHETLTRSLYGPQAGATTAYDFVELPSQMMENFAWEPKYINLMAKHYRTGKKMPKSMQESLLSSKTYGTADLVTRQLAMSIVDQEIHALMAKEPLQIFAEKQFDAYIPGNTPIPGGLFLAGWTHVGGDDYAAGYYAYMWSLAYAHDCYGKFQNATSVASVGKKYREEIFEVGSSRPEAVSLQKFLGRNPSNKAFLKAIGISAKKKKK
ncbi:MAG: thimet oligopeptidase [Planctomycetota bacterium]|jgi:thimet oligopeptidase